MLVSLHPKSIPRIYKHEKSDYLFQDNRFFLSDPPGARTQDPNIKSVVLYLLSY